ncbi:MAG TPA: hypothetical protein VF815_29285 [Myxococcaceae bacterium]|jgi:hypothetical protein
MSPSFRILLLTVPLLTGCESFFFVEAKTEELCKTQQDLSFPAAIAIPGTVSQTFNFPVKDLTATIPTGDTEAFLTMKLFELTPTGGNPDLSGIERATLSLRLDEQDPGTTLLEYRRSSSNPNPQKLSATGSGVLDLQKVLRQEELELTMEASGVLPTRQWTADLRVCAGLSLKADFFDVLF